MTNETRSKSITIKQAFAAVGGSILGLPVGFHLAHLFLVFAGPLVYDPTTWRQVGGAIALLGIPIGTLAGFLAGGVVAGYRPGLYLVTFLPLAILFISQDVTRGYLRTIDKPREYIVRIDGPKGAAYRGAVRVGNVTQPIEGTLPDEHRCEGLSLELAIALSTSHTGQQIFVDLLVNGKSSQLGGHADKGLIMHWQSHGFDEWAGGTSLRGQYLWEDSQVADILEKQIIPVDPIAKWYHEQFPTQPTKDTP